MLRRRFSLFVQVGKYEIANTFCFIFPGFDVPEYSISHVSHPWIHLSKLLPEEKAKILIYYRYVLPKYLYFTCSYNLLCLLTLGTDFPTMPLSFLMSYAFSTLLLYGKSKCYKQCFLAFFFNFFFFYIKPVQYIGTATHTQIINVIHCWVVFVEPTFLKYRD